jgi:hypothetical protein
VHALLRLGAQQVADAGLEVADGLLPVALGPHVLVDVSEPVRPTFKLNLTKKNYYILLLKQIHSLN